MTIKCKSIEVTDQGVQCKFENVFATSLTNLVVNEENFSVETVSFENSRLHEIPNDIFRKFQNLKYLDVDSTGLQKITKENFANCKNFKYLLARKNEIYQLYENTFTNCLLVKIVILDDNRISFVDLNAFAGLRNLKGLSLSGNRLTSLMENVFKPLINLEILRLDSNKFNSIPDDLFKFNDRLKVLKLSNNNLTEFNDKIFNKMPFLEEFSIANNNLTELDLTYCRSTEIDVMNNQLIDVALNKWNERFYGQGNPIQNLTLHEHYGTLRVYNMSFEKVHTITLFVSEKCCPKRHLQKFTDMIQNFGDLKRKGFNARQWRCKILKTLGYRVKSGMIINVECRKFNEEFLDSEESNEEILFGPIVTIDYSEINIETLTEPPFNTEVIGIADVDATIVEVFPITPKIPDKKHEDGIWTKIKQKASGWKNKVVTKFSSFFG